MCYSGDIMGKKKQTIVSLDKEQVEWLESKAEEGYSKSGLIRYAINRLMEGPPKAEGLETGHKHPTKQIHTPPIHEKHITQLDPKPEKQVVQPDSDLEKVIGAVTFYRRNPWAIDRIKDEQVKTFIIKIIKKIEESLPVGGPLPGIKSRRGRPSKAAIQHSKDWYGPSYKPQRAPDGSKIGTPQTGAKYEDMETSLAVLAWALDNPGEPMPRWLYDAQTKWFIDQYKKIHTY